MLSFRRVDVIIIDVGAPDRNSSILLCWELVTQQSGLDATSFYVERSLSPQFDEGQYEIISNAVSGADGQLIYEYNDITANLISHWRMYFYRVRAETSEGTVYSDTKTWQSSPRPHELEIIERHNYVLRNIQGQPSFAFVERTAGGGFCSWCYDKATGRSRISNCTHCLNTGRERPYFNPIPFYVDHNPSEHLIHIASLGELQPKQKDCWFSAYPMLKPGDFIYTVLTGELYRIVKLTPIQAQGTTIQQVARITALEKHDVEYSVLPAQISEDELKEIVREWELIKQERMF